MSEELSRRDFLRVAAAVPLGVAVTGLALPEVAEISREIAQVTNVQTGNAGNRSQTAAACQDLTPQQCMDDYIHSPGYIRELVWDAPANEEVLFRTTPAFVMDLASGLPELKANPNLAGLADFIQTPTHNALIGTRELATTRREVIVGAITTLLFGAAHNITTTADKHLGFDTQTIPAAQTMFGESSGRCSESLAWLPTSQPMLLITQLPWQKPISNDSCQKSDNNSQETLDGTATDRVLYILRTFEP